MITFVEKLEEPTTSTIFLNNVSVVDHGFIDDKGCIRGGSFNPNFIVSGTPDPVEKVVVDFSTIKKDIKASIDKNVECVSANGFDHKVWVIDGYSNVSAMERIFDGTYRYRITTPNLVLELPIDAVKVIPRHESMIPAHSIAYIGDAFATHVKADLILKYPNIDVQVECVNTVDEQTTIDLIKTRPFHYVHGLKDSTSYGCQNIAHGHRSFIHCDSNSHEAYHALMAVSSWLDDTVFVRADNIVAHDDNWLTLDYTTECRGQFKMILNTDNHKIVVLPTETTVEFLVAYVVSTYSRFLRVTVEGRNNPPTQVYVSEGLNKGSLATM